MFAKQKFKDALVSGGRWYARGRASERRVVLCYHSVHPTKKFATVTPGQFDQHLQWLKQTCRVVDFHDIPIDGPTQRKPTVAITFDDGFADNFEYAFPLLCKHGLTATFFVTSGLIARDAKVLERFMDDRSAPLEDVRPMTWENLHEMGRHGMEIGDHTYGHPNLARLDADAALREFIRSRDVLTQRLGRDVRATAYPYGKYRRHYTRETMDAAREAGFARAGAVAFRTVHADDSPWALPRFFVSRDDISTLSDKVFGAWDVIGHLQDRVPVTLARLVSPLDFGHG